MAIEVVGRIRYQNKMGSKLLILSESRLRNIVRQESLGMWDVSGDEIIYRGNAIEDLNIRDVAFSLFDLVNILSGKAVFCDGKIDIISLEEIVHLRLRKEKIDVKRNRILKKRRKSLR